MPETAEAPEVQTSSTPDEGYQMPEGLRNLLDRVLPDGNDSGEQIIDENDPEPDAPDEETEKAVAAASKPAKKVVAEKPPVDPSLRLAPDLTEKKEAAPEPEPDVVITEEMIKAEKNPKKQADMRKLGQALDRYRAENAELKAKTAAPAADAGQQVMIEDLRKQINEANARLERVDLASSPKFQRDFVQPRNKMFMEAKAVLQEAGADPEALDTAVGLTGRARIDAFDQIVESIPSQTLRDRFGRLMDGVDSKNREINEALKDARQNRERLTKQETIDRHEAIMRQETEMKTALQIARRDLAENAKIPVLQKTGDPNYAWWDKIVDEVDTLAEDFMLRATPDMLPKIAYGAAMVDPLLDMFKSERKARQAAEKRLAEYEGAEPGLGEDKRKPKDTEVPDDADIKTAVFAHLKSGR